MAPPVVLPLTHCARRTPARGHPAASLASLVSAAASGTGLVEACPTRVALLCRALLECAEPLPDETTALLSAAHGLRARPWRAETGTPWADLPPAAMAAALHEALLLAQGCEDEGVTAPTWQRSHPLSRAPQPCARVAAEPVLYALCANSATLASGGSSDPEELPWEAARRLLVCIPHEGRVLPPRLAPYSRGLCDGAWAEEQRAAVAEAEEVRLRRVGRLPPPPPPPAAAAGTASIEEQRRLRCPGGAGGCWAAAASRGAETEQVWREAPGGDRRPLVSWALPHQGPSTPRAGRAVPSSSALSSYALAAAASLAEGRLRPAAGALAAFTAGAWRVPAKGLRWLPLVARCAERVQGIEDAPPALLEAACFAVAACGTHGSGVGAAASARLLQRLASAPSPAAVPALCALAALWACNGKTWPRVEASLRGVLRSGPAEAATVAAAAVLRSVCRRAPSTGADAVALIELLVPTASAAAPDAVLAYHELCRAGAIRCSAAMRACAAVARSGRCVSLFAPGRTLSGAPDSLVSAHSAAVASTSTGKSEGDGERCLEACLSLAAVPLQLAVPAAADRAAGPPPSLARLAAVDGGDEDDERGPAVSAPEVAEGAAALFSALACPSPRVRRRALCELGSAHPLCTGLVEEEEASGADARSGGDSGPVLAALATSSAALRVAVSHVAFADPCEECRSAAARVLGRAASVASRLPRLQPPPLRRAGSESTLGASGAGGPLRDVEVPGYGRWQAAKRQRGWRALLHFMPDSASAGAAERPWIGLVQRVVALADSASPPGQQQAEAEAVVAGVVEAVCSGPGADAAWTWDRVHTATLCAHVALRTWVLSSRTLFFTRPSAASPHRCLTVVDGVRALVRACRDAASASSRGPSALAWGAAALVAALVVREGGESAAGDSTARADVELLCRRGDPASQALARAVAPDAEEKTAAQWATAPDAVAHMAAALYAERAVSLTCARGRRCGARRVEVVKAAWASVANAARAGRGGCSLGESVRRVACAHAVVVGPPTDPEASSVLALLARSRVPVEDRDRVGIEAAAGGESLWELARGVASPAGTTDVGAAVTACAVLSGGGAQLHPSLLSGAQRACEAAAEEDPARAVDAVLALCGAVLPTLVHSVGVGSVGASVLSPKHEKALREALAAGLGAARAEGAAGPLEGESGGTGERRASARDEAPTVSVYGTRQAGVFDQLSEAASSVAGSEVSDDEDPTLSGAPRDGPGDDDVDALLGGPQEDGPGDDDVDALLGGAQEEEGGPGDDDVDALLGGADEEEEEDGPVDDDVDALLGGAEDGPGHEAIDAPQGSSPTRNGYPNSLNAPPPPHAVALRPWLALARAALTPFCSDSLAVRDADLSDDAAIDTSAARALVWQVARLPYACTPVTGAGMETHSGLAVCGRPLCAVGDGAGGAPSCTARLPSSSPLHALARAAEGACVDRPAGSRVRALDAGWVPTATVGEGDCGATGRAATLALMHACTGAALHTLPQPGLLAAARALPGGASASGRCTVLRLEAISARVLGRLVPRHGDAAAEAAAIAIGRCAAGLGRGDAGGAEAEAWKAVGEGLPHLVGHGALALAVEAIVASAARCPLPQRALFLLASAAPAVSRCGCESPAAGRDLCTRLLRGVGVAVGAGDGSNDGSSDAAETAALVAGVLLGAWVLGAASRGGSDECLSALPSALRAAPDVAKGAGLPQWLGAWALATATLVVVGHGRAETQLAACAAAAGASAGDARRALASSAWPRPSLPRAVPALRDAAWLQQQLLTALRDAVHAGCAPAAAGVAQAAAELGMGAGACHVVQGDQGAGLLRFALGAKARATLLQAVVRAAGDLEAVDGGTAAQEAGTVLARAITDSTAVEVIGEAATSDARKAVGLQ